MTLLHEFKREERLPSYFANRLQDFLSAARTDLRLTRKSATEVEVAPVEPYGIAAIDLQGLWRFRETPVVRAHPGGEAGTYIVWAVGTKQKVVEAPKPFTDETDYKFDLRITSGADPSGAGVEVFEKIGEIAWSGSEITALAQTYNAVTGPMIQAGALSNNGDISWARDANGAWVSQLKAGVVTDADIAAANKDGAAATPSMRTLGTGAAQAAAGNDARLTDERPPKDNSVTSAKIVNATIKKEDLATEARNVAWYRKIDNTEDFFFEQTTYKFMDSVAGIVVPANALILVAYSCLHRGGASGATHYAAIFFNEIQLKVPANNTQATPTAQEVSYVAGANFSSSFTFLYTTPWGLVTPGVNTSGTEVARVEGEAIAATGVGGGFVAVRGLAAGTYEIGIKLKSSNNYSRVKYRNLQIGICAPGA